MDRQKLRGVLEKAVVAVTVAAVCAGVFTLGYFTKVWTTPPIMRELEYVLEMIEENYIGEFDREAFIAAAVRGTLDRYSAYYTPSEYDEIELSRDGISTGRLGLSFSGDSPKVVSVSGNSPAERAGIEVGDVITGIKVDGGEYTPVEKYSQFNAVCAGIGKEVPFTIRINGADGEREYVIQKEDFIESYVWYQDSLGSYNCTKRDGAWVLSKREKPLKTQIKRGFCYIKLSSFNGAAAEQIRAALGMMKQNGIKKAVLDLRGNGGGYMDILTDIAGCFIPGKNKQLVTEVIYKSGKTYGFYTEKNSYSDYSFESITVLCNGGTASASEALIGAMLDYDESHGKNIVRVIVSKNGALESTYGKGIMQTTFTYSSGSAIKLTTAKIFWPVSGTCIHGAGISEKTDERVTAVSVSATEDAELNFALS